jgi:hypothetical protein
MKTHIYSAFSTLKIGIDLLKERENIHIVSIIYLANTAIPHAPPSLAVCITRTGLSKAAAIFTVLSVR